MNIAIYSRKSLYTDKGESINVQIELCKKHIFTKMPDIKEEDITIFKDEGFSGKNTDRPEFQKMLRLIQNKRFFDYVVCYRLDRISRNVSDFANLIETLNEYDVSFICIKEEFDTSKPMGKAMMYIASVFAQLERETIAERVKDNLLGLARTGRWLGGYSPLGFISVREKDSIINGKVNSFSKLEVDCDKIGLVMLIYEKFIELESINGVCKYLNRNNYQSVTNKLFKPLMIRDILSNPVYCTASIEAREYFISQNCEVVFEEKDCTEKYGILPYNRRNYSKKHPTRNPPDMWIIAIGKHKGIIPGEQWVKIQNILEQKKNPCVSKHTHDALLSGLIHCQKCHSKMFAKHRTSSTGNYKRFDYICNTKLINGVKFCDCPNLPGAHTDDVVTNYLLNYVEEDSDINKLIKETKSQIKNYVNPINEIDNKINKYTQEIDNLFRTLLVPNLNPILINKVNDGITDLQTKINDLNLQKKTFQLDSAQLTDMEIQLDIITNTLSNFKENYKKLSIVEKRKLVRLLIEKIEWDGEKLNIFIYGEQ